MNLSKRVYIPELMDLGQYNERDFRRNLKELEWTNKLLGGHAATLRAFRQQGRIEGSVKIADVGCGGGDTLAQLVRFCEKQKIEAEFYGIDYNEVAIQYAKEKLEGYANIQFIQADFRTVSQPFDFIFCSLFTHHLNEPALEEYLCWCQKYTRRAFIINDLERNSLAYYAISMLCMLLPLSYLYRHDAPLSVRRSFKRKDWEAVGRKLNIKLGSIGTGHLD